jgi:hypothetical protein
VTKLDSKLYVVYWESDTVNVYTSQHPYKQLHSIHINGLSFPTSVAACSINSCLYIADLGACVWRLRTDGKVDKWLETVRVLSVSVTSDGHVVTVIAVASGKPNAEWYGVVDIYNQVGVKLTRLRFPYSIVNPCHVIPTISKSFIVCYGLTTQLQQVCEVNNEGAIVKSYGNLPGHDKGQLNTPEHIAITPDE